VYPQQQKSLTIK